MKKTNLILFIGLIFLSSNLFAKEMRALTVYGKVDPRLYVYIKSTYRSQSPDEMRKNYEECTRTDWNTNGARRTLTYDIADIVPNKNGTYKTTIPIDYVGKDKCGWEYVATELILKRDKKDEEVVFVGIVSMKNEISSYRSKGTGSVGILSLSTTKKHFQLSSGSKIGCYTNHFPISKHFKKPATSFICSPKAFSSVNGVDKFQTANINIDIVINKNKCLKHPSGEQDYFRDYKEPLNRFKQLELDIKQFINNIFS